MARDDPQMKLRMPVELRDRIADLAAESGRSMNAEIVVRLQKSITQDFGPAFDKQTEDFLARPNLTTEDLVNQIKFMADEHSKQVTNLVTRYQKAVGLNFVQISRQIRSKKTPNKKT
ncbi:Arc family DNA-binding protein [Methylobacterium gnaphalii]|uniref:Arc-like DNA binding domain-containing protein n=1 Tax=Methylobacterium gnaphalii TaxID=1010610 RepID=A0A512JMD5_9HYPH|nr:Arc family DNA-binding protein [Methylobacterium gnaphalii]GEP11127.1 hypothetical protein MGN01_29720 [Methylobacterium gnaphalii]GLS50405.1 hypothetical protein GCM10007885_32570 [Methylobacterium gnaphalii]